MLDGKIRGSCGKKEKIREGETPNYSFLFFSLFFLRQRELLLLGRRFRVLINLCRFAIKAGWKLTMNSLKEKAADTLSRLLADTSSHFSRDSSVVSPDPEARPLSKEGVNNSEKSLSSFITSLLPSATFGGRKSNRHQNDTKMFQSLSSKWRSKSFKWEETPLDFNAESGPAYNDKEMQKKIEEDEVHASSRNIKDADKCEEASTSHVPSKVAPGFIENSSFISSDLYEFFQSSLPNIVKGCQWVLLYRAVR